MPTPQETLISAIAHFNLTDTVTPEAVDRTVKHHGLDSELLGLFRCVHAMLASALYNLDEEHRSFEGILAWTSIQPDRKGWFFFVFEEGEDYELYLQSRPSFEPLLDEAGLRLLEFFERNLLNRLTRRSSTSQ